MPSETAEAMRVGASRYDDVLSALALDGWSVTFTQTGGMCAALEVQLERGHLLVTDASEELPWKRGQLRGWGVGYYAGDDHSEGPLAYCEDEDNCSVDRLRSLLRDCLTDAARVLAAGQ